MNQSPLSESIVLSTKEIQQLMSSGVVEILRPIDVALVQPEVGAYFDRYHKGPQWNWWTKDNKQCLCQIIRSPFLEGHRMWVKEIHSTSFVGMYPFPKAWYKTDFFGRITEPIDPIHVRNCSGNDGDCPACAEEREGKFKWTGPSKMPKKLSRFNVTVENVSAVFEGRKSFWKVTLREERQICK